MKKIIKQILGKYFKSPFAFIDFSEECPFEFKKFPGYFRSFGKKNPDKVFYVIWREKGGFGFFSNMTHVLRHLKIADQEGMIPVVDCQNFKNWYNEKTVINNTKNSWEYYFQQVSPFQLAEVYESKNVFFCSGSCPPGMDLGLTVIKGLHEIYKKYVFLQKHAEDLVEEHSAKLNGTVLGVYFRGQEYKQCPRHAFPPTEKQMLRCADEIIEKYKIERIFVSTEELSYLDLFVKRYGNRVVHTDCFRTYDINAYNLNPREKHRYLLGLEILIEAFLLSRCNGLLYSESNVPDFARFINNGNYEFTYKIDNGLNSSNRLIARYLYGVKKLLPPCLGGLPGRILITPNVNKVSESGSVRRVDG